MAQFQIIRELLDQLTEDAESTNQSIVDRIFGQIDFLLQDIDSGEIQILNGLFSPSALAGDIGASILGELDKKIKDALEAPLSQINRWYNQATNRFDSHLDDVRASFDDTFGDALNNIESSIGIDLNFIENVATDIKAKIEDEIGKVDEFTGGALSGFNSGLEEWFTKLFDELDEAVGEPLGKLGSDAILVLQAIQDGINKFDTGLTNFNANIVNAISNSIKTFTGFNFDEMWPDLEEKLDPILRLIEENPSTPQEVKDMLKPGFPAIGPIALFVVPIVLAAAVMPFAGALMAGNIEEARQMSFRREKQTLFTPAEIDLLKNRDSIPEDIFQHDLQSHGYNTEHIALREKIREVLLPVGELFALVNRGEISQEDFRIGISNLGYSPDSFTALDELRHPLPAIQDMIRFSVREVYDQTLRAELGLDQEFPPDFIENMEKHGFKEDAIRDYWAAHWVLPSLQMGFEMYHRGVVDLDGLILLMKTQDIGPAYRQPLIDIAYRPYTRVDIRRMHLTGVLSEFTMVQHGDRTINEIQAAYESIGFSPDKAQKMVEFTIAYNTPKADDEVKALTRSQVLKFYREKLYDRSTTVTNLEQMGYDSPTAELFVTLEDLDEQEKQVELSVKTIKTRLRNGVIDITDAITSFDALDIPSAKRELILAEVSKEREENVRLPSRADLDKFIGAGLVSNEQYVAKMLDLGYTAPDTQNFLALATSEEAVDEFEDVRLRQLTPSQILRLYREGLIDGTAAIARLVNRNYGAEDARLLIESVNLEIGEV